MSSEKDSLVEYCDPIRVKKNDQKLSGNYSNHLHGQFFSVHFGRNFRKIFPKFPKWLDLDSLHDIIPLIFEILF